MMSKKYENALKSLRTGCSEDSEAGSVRNGQTLTDGSLRLSKMATIVGEPENLLGLNIYI